MAPAISISIIKTRTKLDKPLCPNEGWVVVPMVTVPQSHWKSCSKWNYTGQFVRGLGDGGEVGRWSWKWRERDFYFKQTKFHRQLKQMRKRNSPFLNEEFMHLKLALQHFSVVHFKSKRNQLWCVTIWDVLYFGFRIDVNVDSIHGSRTNLQIYLFLRKCLSSHSPLIW